jgi:flagellar motility protein MotE (MotC chaperone)
MKKLIMVGVLAAVCFVGSYFVTNMLSKKPNTKHAATSKPAEQVEQVTDAGADAVRMKEKEMDEIIKEMRGRRDELARRERDLEDREKRLQIAQDTLKKQVTELETLRLSMVAPLTNLRQATTELVRSRVNIKQEEQANLKKIAAKYEKMDATQGSKTLMAMCTNNQEDDAARILNYMSARAVANWLSEMSDKQLVAKLTDRMKRIKEEG